jgi:RNA polymerase sigma factor (sigma-70 family)
MIASPFSINVTYSSHPAEFLELSKKFQFPEVRSTIRDGISLERHWNYAMESDLIIADNELLGRYLTKQDESAFAELVNRHSAMVMAVCRNMLLHSQDAEDAFQATFLVLSKKASKLLDRGSLAGWLYEVAVRNSLEVRRRKGRARESAMVDEIMASTNEPWRTISSAQEREHIHAEIRRLPKQYRDAIVLCHFSGYTRSEAAELLGTTQASVKAALARGRTLLRKQLVRYGIISSALLMMLRTNTTNANRYISEPLIQSTLQLCKGVTPKVSTGSSPEFIHSISQAGTHSMNTISLMKTLSCAVAFLIAIAIPVAIYAQKTVDPSYVVTLQLPTSGVIQDSNTIEVTSFDAAAENQGDDMQLENSAPSNVEEESVPDDWFLQVQYTDSNAANNAKFLPRNSAEYWRLMMKSYQTRINSLGQSSASVDTSNVYEYKAKMIEAELNLKRIEAGLIVDSNGNMIEPNTATVLNSSKSESRALENQGTMSGFADPKQKTDVLKPSPGANDRVQPGDELTVESLNFGTIRRRVVVASDYTIRLPLVRSVNVKDKSIDAIEQVLNERYSEYMQNDPGIFVARAGESVPMSESLNRE